MTAADWHDITVTACTVVIITAGFLALGSVLGWVQWSMSVKVILPWNRKAAEPRARTLPAEQPAAAPVPLDQRRAG